MNPAPEAEALRAILKRAMRPHARNTWRRLNGVTNPQDVSHFLCGKADRPPLRVYDVLGFDRPMSQQTLIKMRAALARLKSRQEANHS